MTTKTRGEMLRQVVLERPIAGGVKRDVFWIDNALAIVGKRVRDEDGEVWTVAEAYNAKLFSDVDKQREAWKRWADVLGDH